nr:MAG TPA: hypothetical protein [Caudoviricetes sp.]
MDCDYEREVTTSKTTVLTKARGAKLDFWSTKAR